MKIETEISDKNEGTAYPWWVLVPKRSRMSTNDFLMSMVGPFFSREEADQELSERQYDYPGKWTVWCLHGSRTRQYKRKIDEQKTTRPGGGQ